jgi:hypothetical protein
VEDLAELTGLEHLPCQAHGGHEAVVEGAQVLDAGCIHAVPGLVGLLGVAPERLLADHVLAGLGGGDRRLGVQVVRPRIVEQLQAVVLHELVPVRHVALEPEAARRLGHGLLVATGDRHELGHVRRRKGHVGERLVGVRVGRAHEGVPEHAHADRLDVGRGAGLAHRHEADLVLGHEASFWNAASKATSEGAKSVRRTKASASGAPHSRSMPESSHSIDSGPV